MMTHGLMVVWLKCLVFKGHLMLIGEWLNLILSSSNSKFGLSRTSYWMQRTHRSVSVSLSHSLEL